MEFENKLRKMNFKMFKEMKKKNHDEHKFKTISFSIISSTGMPKISLRFFFF